MADEQETPHIPHILIVDDNRTNIEVVKAFLDDEGYVCHAANNGKEALTELFEQAYDLVLLDINMPVMDGFATIERLKQDKQTKDIPVIFLTAENDIDSMTRAFESGAVDYVRKPFNGAELTARVKTHLQLRLYMREIEEKQNRLAQLVATDPVTRTANKLRLLSELRLAMKTAATEGSSLAIVLVGINKLPRYEEMHGYEAADKLLLRFATKVKDMLNDQFLFARLYGGDFMILMPKASNAAALSVANKLIQKIAAENIGGVSVTCSAAVESFQQNDTDLILIRRAEQKLQKARQSGLNIME